VQILHQEAGDDHPHPVVHEPLGQQLPHAGVDDREARATLLPRLHEIRQRSALGSSVLCGGFIQSTLDAEPSAGLRQP
jgi:hypothetical protein